MNNSQFYNQSNSNINHSETKNSFLSNIQKQIQDIRQREQQISLNLAQKIKQNELQTQKMQKNKSQKFHLKKQQKFQTQETQETQSNTFRSLILPKIQHKISEEILPLPRGQMKRIKLKSKQKMKIHAKNLKSLCEKIKQEHQLLIQTQKGLKSNRNDDKSQLDMSILQQNIKKLKNNKKQQNTFNDSLCNTSLEVQLKSINKLNQQKESQKLNKKNHNLNDVRLQKFQKQNNEVLVKFEHIFKLCNKNTDQQEQYQIFNENYKNNDSNENNENNENNDSNENDDQ